MSKEFKIRSTDIFWSFRLNLGQRPTAFFANTRVATNVIYTINELCSILERTDKENLFIPVPRKVMQSALNEYIEKSTIAA